MKNTGNSLNRANNISKISSAKMVMDEFLTKLHNDELNYDNEPSIGENVKIDEKFIGEQIESYGKLLDSSIIEDIQGPRLVKTRIIQNDKK